MCFFDFIPERDFEQIVQLQVIWVAMRLMWRERIDIAFHVLTI